MKQWLQSIYHALWYGGISREQYEQIRDEVRKSNLQSLKIFSAIAFTFLFITTIITSYLEGYREIRAFYVVPMLLSALIFGVVQCCRLSERSVLILVYLFTSLMYVFAASLGLSKPYEQTVTFIAFLLTVPLLFTDRPLRMIVCILIFMLAYIIAAILRKAQPVMLVDIVDVSIFGAIGAITSTYMMIVKYERHAYIHEVSMLSEMDLLTMLRNRNSFERHLRLYPQQSSVSVSCLYVDVNGLHELNNTQGHEAGDRMLQCVANALKKQFGDQDTYRIGGDELIAFAVDSEEEDVLRRVAAFRQEVQANGYSAALGLATQSRQALVMDTLFKQAEQKMYEDKNNHYESLGGAARRSARKQLG